MRLGILTFFFALQCTWMSAQSVGNVSLGVGRYDFNMEQNFSVKLGMEKNLNKVFSLGLSLNYHHLNETTHFLYGGLPPNEKIEYTTKFEGLSYELTLDAFVLGLADNKFQTHLIVGAGAMHKPQYAFVGYASISLEERVQFSPKHQLGIGYHTGFDLDQSIRLGQGYVSLRRLF